jgi:ferric-dicitrate binding protein FerR (iron transport regulator)
MEQDTTWITDAVRRSVDPDAPPIDSWDVEAALTRVKARNLTRQHHELYSDRRPRAWRTGALIAASIILTVGIAYATRYTSRVDTPRDVGSSAVFVTAMGERRSVRLADGTDVTLGPRSRLEVMPSFAQRTRAVSVEGDVYFHVAPDSAKPFTISTGRVLVQVLGTEFAVRAYAGTTTTQVAVVSGRVSIATSTTGRAGDQRTILTRGDLASLTRRADGTDTVTVTPDADVTSFAAWTRGELVFDDTPLPDVAARIERWYGIAVTVDSALVDRRVTASFLNRRGSDVVVAICGALRANCTQDNGRATISAPPR